MPSQVQLGLKKNWKQFVLLLVVNAFVGSMVGLERTIFPQYAELEFNVSSKTAILSFIIAFGISKAFANYYAGRYANKYGRKSLLITGWILALPIPLMLIYAPSWSWVVIANVLLGLNQGLAWSSTVVMKIDLVGENDRGLAMGLNEFSGYLAVGVVAFITGYIAQAYGVTPYPFYLGIFISVVGLMLSFIWVKDTRAWVDVETAENRTQSLKHIFYETTIRNKTLSSVTQAGMVNNLNDGMIWGLLPMVLAAMSFNSENIGIIVGIYPTVWGIGQLFTGKMADHFNKKKMLFWGMLLQGVVILFLPFVAGFWILVILSSLLGLGTALVYPTFLTTIADATTPVQRAESVGTFRLWRDLGYAFGAIISGITADLFGVQYAILLIGVLTVFSSMIIQVRMPSQQFIVRDA